MCKTVFDKGGQNIPFENVNRTETASDGRLRVFMKNTGEVVLISQEFVEEFTKDFNEFHDSKHTTK